MSKFLTRQYDAYLFLAAPDAENIWNWAQWQKLVPLLSPFMQSLRGRTSIRMTQFPAHSTLSPNQSYIRFGSLGWNAKAHEKWTHGSPQTIETSKAWEFCCAAVWAPGPGICEKQDCPPDGYLTIRNEIQSGMTRDKCKFAYSLMLAVASDVNHDGLEDALVTCKALTQPTLAAKVKTSWTPSFSHNSMSEWEIFGAPFQLGNPHKRLLSLSTLEGSWQAF